MILSGPAGSGKTTLSERLCAEVPKIERVVTCTTRAPREGEVNEVDYHFLDEATFEAKVAEGAFYEYAQVHAYRYGTLKSAVTEPLKAGIDLLLVIDVQGAAALREATREDPSLAKALVSVFVAPADEAQLRQRLAGRGSDNAEEIERRMNTARKELRLWPQYDYFIDSHTQEADFTHLLSIYRAETLRSARRASA